MRRIAAAALVVVMCGGTLIGLSAPSSAATAANPIDPIVKVVQTAVQEVDTLAGYVATRIGRVPVRGELIPGPGPFELEILDADPRRLKKLRASLWIATKIWFLWFFYTT